MKEPNRHIHRKYNYIDEKQNFSIQSEQINYNMLSDDQIKISQLPLSIGIDDNDIIPIVEVSGSGLITKKISFDNFKNSTFNSTLSPSGNIEFYYDNNSSTLYIYTNPTGIYDTLIVNNKTGSGLLVYNNSPTLTGVPLSPTASSGTNTFQIANTQFVRTEIANLVNSAPSTLDTLNELASALGNDPNFATTIINSLATKASLSGAAFSGYVVIPSGSGNFDILKVNNINVSISGHNHISSDISNFNSSVSGLLPTISNSGNNKLLTSVGTPYDINAEDNLTFDGQRLTINCTCASGNAGLIVIGDNKNTLIQSKSYSEPYVVPQLDDLLVKPTNRVIFLTARGSESSPSVAQSGDTIFILRGDAYNPYGAPTPTGGIDNRSFRMFAEVSNSGLYYMGTDFIINTSTGGSSLYDNTFRFTHDGKLVINGINIASPSGLDINNNGNNRILTGTGSGINAETNFTFDGTTLNLDNLSINNNSIVVNDNNLTLQSSGNIYLIPSGSGCIVAGLNNSIGSVSYSTIGGGDSNSIQDSNAVGTTDYCVIAGGYDNTIDNGTGSAYADYSNIGGGYDNIIYETSYSSIGGGYNNDIGYSADYSVIGGGYSNMIRTEHFSTIPGGSEARTYDRGEFAYANGKFSNVGDAQYSMYVLKTITNSSGWNSLYLDYGTNSDNAITMDATTATFVINISARSNSGGDSAGFIIRGCVKKYSGSLSLVGSPIIESFVDSNFATANVQIYTSGSGLIIQVDQGTSGVSGNIHWVATVQMSRVTI